MNVAEHIVSLERSALDRWIRADPDGYLSLYARDATYFDPFREKRVDGLNELNALMAPMRGVTLPFTSGSAEETVLARWNATEIYCEVDREWRIVHTHWSFTQPQPAEAQR